MDELKTFRFGAGSHKTREDGMCVMECVSYLAGERHSDSPQCACPVITMLAIWVNDTASDELRTHLLLDMPWRIVGTKSTPDIERQRGFMAADWAVRVVAPIVLRRAGLVTEAEKLESLPEVKDDKSASDAARYAASAASYAASAASYEASYAASAASDAARYAASDAASYAARYAASDLDTILRSCADLISRMIELTEPKEQACVLRTKRRELLGV